jgi:hypothetical protein
VALKRGRLGQSLRATISEEDRRDLAAYAASLAPDEETAAAPAVADSERQQQI